MKLGPGQRAPPEPGSRLPQRGARAEEDTPWHREGASASLQGVELAWKDGADGELAVVLDAIDAERRDARDIAAFLGRARAPDPGDAVPGTRGTSAKDVAIVVAGLGAGAVLADLVVSASLALGHTPSPYVGPVAFVVGALLPGLLVLALRVRRVRAFSTTIEDRFELTLDRRGFSLVGHARQGFHVPSRDLHAFEGGRRLVLVRHDGSRVELPCDVGDVGTHRIIAARFTDALARRRVADAGYRGA